MAYEKQGFYSGQPLMASQLDAMEDGIINAEKLAIEAASQGVQSDYNESDSTAASYIKNRPFYEGFAFDPIVWDGVIGDRENVDVSHLIESEAGTVFMVKLSDNDKLTTEDYIGSTITMIISGEEQTLEVTENDVIPVEQANVWGMCGQIQSIVTVFDVSLANSSLGVNLQSSGTYGFYSEVLSQRAKSILKPIIKKIDEKFLPAAFLGANMETGAGENSSQQLQNQESGVTEGYFNFVGKNPVAIDADPSLNAELKYGAVGDYSVSFGGKSTAIGKRAFSEGTTTVAKGAYSHAEGNNSVTLGANSHAEGKCTVTIGENSHSEGFETVAGEFNSHAEGYKTITKGSAAHAEGQETKAYSHQTHAEGLRTVAGDETNPEIGAYAHAEGQDTVAKGEASHAAGIGTIAAGRAQTVVGRYNIEAPDNEDGSGLLFIVGNGNGDPEGENERNIAFAVASTGEAFMNYMGEATNEFSLVNAGQVAAFVEMLPTNIKNGNGANSIAGGFNSIADYSCDFTFGEGLSNTFEHQTIFGRYNDNSNWGGNRPLFMIGNGTAAVYDESGNMTQAEVRSNAFEVRNDGTVAIKYNGKKYSLQKLLEALSAFADSALLTD